MVGVDGGARPGDVVVAHMPMWARIYDAPPIMLFELVAREIGTTRENLIHRTLAVARVKKARWC